MSIALQTDLYELTMMAGYWRAGLAHSSATFELFVRRLPPGRSYLIAAGLEPAIEHLERLTFPADDRAWLRTLPQFAHVPREFFDEYLARFTFTGDVWAMPEGTPVFANEPILRVTAPLASAQLVETALLSIVTFQTSVATKATRVVQAAAGRSVIEFGARRAHGLGAALAAARAAYIGGCAGTSFVEAARTYGIPTSGTMAHAWVQAFPTEIDAFREFSRSFAGSAVYLLDTYDSRRAAERLAGSGLRPPSVRLDSGDVSAVSRDVRRILDQAGLVETKIFVTGDLDEIRIDALVRDEAPIDGFGVGTALTTVSDAPALSAVYKLAELEREGREVGVVKLSSGKRTRPYAKQVWRLVQDGRMKHDVVAATHEAAVAGAVPLLQRVMAAGRRVVAPESLETVRVRRQAAVATLPVEVCRLDGPARYRVVFSDALEAARSTLARDVGRRL